MNKKSWIDIMPEGVRINTQHSAQKEPNLRDHYGIDNNSDASPDKETVADKRSVDQRIEMRKKKKALKSNLTKKQITRQRLGVKRVPRPDDKRKSDFQRIPPQSFYSGTILKLLTLSPKKPNSAVRKAAQVRLSNGIIVIAYIPGEKHAYQVSAKVDVRWCKRRDLIGVRFMIVRKGPYAVIKRKNARSKYGTQKPKNDNA